MVTLMHTYSRAHKAYQLIHVSICVGLIFSNTEQEEIKTRNCKEGASFTLSLLRPLKMCDHSSLYCCQAL